jgi:hypothetical protein
VLDLSTFDKPHQYSTGFQYVLVNGKISSGPGEAYGSEKWDGVIWTGLYQENSTLTYFTATVFMANLTISLDWLSFYPRLKTPTLCIQHLNNVPGKSGNGLSSFFSQCFYSG